MGRGGAGPFDVDVVDDLEPLRDDWRRLSLRSRNVFSTWEWAATWSRHARRDRPMKIVVCRRPDGEVAALLPLLLSSRRPVRLVRFIGHGPADELGPVCAPEDRPAALDVLAGVLARRPFGAGLFVGDRFLHAGRLGGTALLAQPCPVLRTQGRSFDEWLASCSRNMREQVRRRARRLFREREVTIRQTVDTACLSRDFATLVDLHDRRWAGASGAFAGWRRAFHEEFAQSALTEGWLRLSVLELDGRPAAAWYGLAYGDVVSYYQAGREPAEDRWSPGWVLLCRSIQEAFDAGASEYRFLLGGEAYKFRFASEADTVLTFGLPLGISGHATVAAARTVRSLPRGVRRRAIALAG